MKNISLKKAIPSRLRYLIYIIPLGLLIASAVVLISGVIVNNNRKYIYHSTSELSDAITSNKPVAMVLGSSVDNNLTPSEVVKSRLEAAALLYFDGVVKKIIVSGDNRHVNYNEPFVMQEYLQNEYGIPSSVIQQDNAGRSTYESCDRAKNVFQLDELIVVSQQSHVPRAIYLCRSFGIATYGFSSPNSHRRFSQSLREMAANVKAVYNVYFFGMPTIYGDPIKL